MSYYAFYGFLYVPSWISLCPFVDFFMSLRGFLYVLFISEALILLAF